MKDQNEGKWMLRILNTIKTFPNCIAIWMELHWTLNCLVRERLMARFQKILEKSMGTDKKKIGIWEPKQIPVSETNSNSKSTLNSKNVFVVYLGNNPIIQTKQNSKIKLNKMNNNTYSSYFSPFQKKQPYGTSSSFIIQQLI